MGIENNNDLQPILDDRPFFENHLHCESWTDEALLILETEPPRVLREKDLVTMKRNLDYAKKLLNQSIFPLQEEINTEFHYLMREIMEEEDSWGELGSLYAKIYNYLAIEMAQENQD